MELNFHFNLLSLLWGVLISFGLFTFCIIPFKYAVPLKIAKTCENFLIPCLLSFAVFALIALLCDIDSGCVYGCFLLFMVAAFLGWLVSICLIGKARRKIAAENKKQFSDFSWCAFVVYRLVCLGMLICIALFYFNNVVVYKTDKLVLNECYYKSKCVEKNKEYYLVLEERKGVSYKKIVKEDADFISAARKIIVGGVSNNNKTCPADIYENRVKITRKITKILADKANPLVSLSKQEAQEFFK